MFPEWAGFDVSSRGESYYLAEIADPNNGALS
jgi:hypothetical protein